MHNRASLEEKLEKLNHRIAEAEARLGAHSIKPILMQQLFELEEERAALQAQIDRSAPPSPASSQ